MGWGFRLLTWPVAVVACLLPLLYLATAAALLVAWYWLWQWGRQQAWSPAVQGLLAGGGLVLLLGLVKPLVVPAVEQWPRRRFAGGAGGGQELLAAWVEGLAQALQAPPPRWIVLECSPQIGAAPRGGLLGLCRKDLVLTMGLPLVASLRAEELAILVVQTLAPFRRKAAPWRMWLIRRMQEWVWRGVFENDRWDDWLARKTRRRGWHAGKCLLPLVVFKKIEQAALWVPMFLADTLAGPVVRRSLLDADGCAALLGGRRNWHSAVARQRIAAFHWEGLLAELDFLAREQRLPDSLPHELMRRMAEVTPELGTALLETVARPVEQRFDCRPDDDQRRAWVAEVPEEGPLVARWPAWRLLAEGVEVARGMTRELYRLRLSPLALQTQLSNVVRLTPWTDASPDLRPAPHP